MAILFGVLVANATTQDGVDRLFADFAGTADVLANPVGVFNADLPDGTITQLRALPDVTDVVGSYGFDTTLPNLHRTSMGRRRNDIGGSGAFVAAIVRGGDGSVQNEKLQKFVFAAGRFPAPGANEIVFPKTLADEVHRGIGDKVTVPGHKTTASLEIVGLLAAKGAGRAGRGSVVFTSNETAHRLSGDAPNVYKGASLVLRDGVKPDAWLDAHQDAVAGVRLVNATNIAAGFKQFLQTFGVFLTFFAAITLFVGAFLIYLTLSMAVIERTRMYGTLRALGATRQQVRRVVLTESIALGAVSTAAGLVLGLGLAAVLLKLIAKLFDLDLTGLVIAPGAVIGAVVTGLLVTVLSSLIPARRAGRLAPVEAMKGDYASETKLGRGWIAGASIVIVCGALYIATAGGSSPSLFAAPAVIGMLMGSVLLVPLLLRPLASALGKITNRLARGIGDIAVLHLAKERSRSAYTLALVMVVLAMLFATGGLYLSVRAAVDEIIARQFGADLFIGSDDASGASSLQTKLLKRPDISKLSPLRFGQTSAVRKNGKLTFFFVRTIEPDSYFDVASYFWKNGDDASAKRALDRGGAVLVSDEIARELSLTQGDEVTLQTRHGKVGFEIAGVYTSPPGPPEVSMGIKDGRRYFAAKDPFAYLAKVPSGTDPRVVATSLQHAYHGKVNVQTAFDAKQEARAQITQYFKIVYAILLIAAIVGLLGLANTLAMSVLHRFREIGILRAIGTTRSQMWRMVLVESSTMGLAAFVLSFPLGWVLTYLVVKTTSSGFGFSMPTVYPWTWIPGVAVFAMVVAVFAAIAPGRRAARLQVVSALQYE